MKFEDVKEACVAYFGDERKADIVINKYLLRDKNDELIEKDPTDKHHRLAKEFARIESKKFKKPLTEEEIFALFDRYRYIIPQGSPAYAIGNPDKYVSTANCFVADSPLDSYGGILHTDQQLAQISKRRGGIGIDLSHIRPSTVPTQNSSRFATGVPTFAERFSHTIREVGQNGRRGALMLTLSIHHPESVILPSDEEWDNPTEIVLKGNPDKFERDINTSSRYYNPNHIDFCTMKLDRRCVTGANISLKLTDEFLEAVEKGEKYEQRFPVDYKERGIKPIISRLVDARKVWQKIIHAAWQSAEPGLLFWDMIIRESPADCYAKFGFSTVSTNPCLRRGTQIITNKGVFPIEKFVPDGIITIDAPHDYKVMSSNGEWVEFIVYKTDSNAELYKIDVEGGESIYCTANHEWNTSHSVVKTYELEGRDFTDYLPRPGGLTRINKVSKTNERDDVYDLTTFDDRHDFLLSAGVYAKNCGEIPLSVLDSCRLLVLNLAAYVKNPFINPSFDWTLYYQHAKIAQRLMDDLVDLELEAIQRIITKIENDPEPTHIKQSELDMWKRIYDICEKGRRTGLGNTAVGDAVAMMNLKYGSDESIKFIERIYESLKIASYESSADMAEELGPFPIWDWELEKDNEFIKRLEKSFFSHIYDGDIYNPIGYSILGRDIVEKIKKFGRRNISNLTTAPVGTKSQLALLGQIDEEFFHETTSGVEPSYIDDPHKRRRKINPSDTGARVDFVDENGDKWQEYDVYPTNVQYWMKLTGETDYTKSPYHGACAVNLDWKQRVKLQAAAQRHIDHSISSTVNLPADATEEQVAEIYLEAWRSGCKGLTIYRDGCRSGVLITNTEKKTPTNNSPKRPKDLPCDIYKVSIKGEKYHVLVGLHEDRPFEVMVCCGDHPELKGLNEGILRKKSRGHYQVLKGDMVIIDNVTESCNPGEDSLTRMTSMLLRHNIALEHIQTQLLKSKDSINSFAKAISRCLKHYVQDIEVSGVECPDCQAPMRFVEGCAQCSAGCGYSKC